jgi:hypothetical protein
MRAASDFCILIVRELSLRAVMETLVIACFVIAGSGLPLG